MSATQSLETFGRARFSFADTADIDEFVGVLDRFERGEIGPDEWRAFRLVRGTYGQRQADDAQMLRVKIPQGLLDRRQLLTLAEVADRYSRGFGHITTRQNVQLHFLKLRDVEPAMRQLADVGLTTREACGNSVRNITACPYSGVGAGEAFDVTPYAEALTRYLLRHPLSSTLPRKFKIAFEGCPDDHVAAGINDIGWFARVVERAGRPARGFRVTVAGGTATLCRAGQVLFDFLPAADMLDVAEAVVRVFHRLGDYKHRQRNRMKFLVRALGWDGFREAFEAELVGVRREGGTRLPFDPDQAPAEGAPLPGDHPAPSPAEVAAHVAATPTTGPGIRPHVAPRLVVHDPDYVHWLESNVASQRQPGWAVVTVTTVLGDLTSGQMRVSGELAAAFGDGTVRVTHDQNLVFRWVRHTDVEALYRVLLAAGLARPGAGTLADVTSCPGAETCRLAVTQSRGLGQWLSDDLTERRELVAAVPGLNIKISGCPNGCGQHHVAGIGFQGSLRKVGGRPAPHYFVLVGGGTLDGVTTFGRHAATIPARRSLEAVERLVDLYRTTHEPGESPLGFFRRVDLAVVRAALVGLDRLTVERATPDDFVDLGESAAFDPSIQEGECIA
jgi:sulfite reductase beta subunit-like hemoprotein